MAKISLLAIFVVLLLTAIITPAHAINNPAQLSDIEGVISNIIGLLAPAAAVAFFVMVLVGGFKFLTAEGDQKAVASARSTLTYAVLGAVLLVVVWLVLVLIQSVLGRDITNVVGPT